MQVAYDVLRLLSDGKFHSGTSLAQSLKISRSSIWKGINFLRQLGVMIQAVPGRGYRWFSPSELLNQSAILALLNPVTKQTFARLDVVNVISSTNDYLLSRLAHGIPHGSVCVAEAQTQGKGRMGKVWRSPFGANIYLSLYWRFPSRLHELSGLSLVIGLAILAVLKEIAPLPSGVGIKWPNDIWHHNAKLCGILIESQSNPAQANTTDVVLGIGLNLQMQEDPALTTDWTDLKRVLGFVPSRNLIIAKILNNLVPYFARFQAKGFNDFATEWAEHDLLVNKSVVLSAAQSQQTGIAKGVNERGELCVKIGETLKAVRYGEVSVKPNNA
jgi:BirA family biotin operon repressor/biotin-[acetyl-CoA-carboxylase] ligase